MKKNNCYTFIGTSGSGNTTLVYKMGRELSQKGKKVLLIDATSSGNLTSLCFDEFIEEDFDDFYNRNDGSFGLYALLEEMIDKNGKISSNKLKEHIYKHEIMDIIPSDIMLMDTLCSFRCIRNEELYLCALIKRINDNFNYDYILIDSASLTECYNMAYKSIIASFFGGIFITAKSNALTHAKALQNTYSALKKAEKILNKTFPQDILDFDSWFMGIIQSEENLKTKDFLNERFNDIKFLSVPVKNVYSQNNVPILVDLLETKRKTIEKRWNKLEEIKRSTKPNKILQDEIKNLNKVVKEKDEEIHSLTQKVRAIRKEIDNAFAELETLKDKNSAIAKLHARNILNKFHKGENSKYKIVNYLINKFGFNTKQFYIEDEKTFDDMVNSRLRYDLYFTVNDKRYIIEIDGEQHHKQSEYFKMSEKDFKKLKEHDQIKNDYVKACNIHMLRITAYEMRRKNKWKEDVDNLLKNSIPGQVLYSNGYPKEFVFQ